jgi:hypothetical protein
VNKPEFDLFPPWSAAPEFRQPDDFRQSINDVYPRTVDSIGAHLEQLAAN